MTLSRSQLLTKVRPYLPLLVGMVMVIIIAILVPWGDILHLLARLRWWTIVLLVLLGMVYYSAKTVRFWVMLRQLGLHKPFGLVALSYISAQPVSLLPAGELYRTTMLKKYTGIPAHKSSPTVVMQGLVEAIVLLAVALAGAVSLGENELVVLVAAVAVIVLVVAIKRGWLSGLGRGLNKLPKVDINDKKLDKFLIDNSTLLTRRTLPLLLALSVIPIAAGVGIVYLSSRGVGAHLSLTQAAIAYCLPVVVSGLSFLPGGLGVSEGGTIGLLHLMNVGTPEAVAITVLVRVFTLGAGLVFGVIGILVAHTVEPVRG